MHRPSQLCLAPSLLLAHMGSSLATLTRLYAEQHQQQQQSSSGVGARTGGGERSSPSSSSSPRSPPPLFPPDPQTAAEGEAVLAFLCAELGMGLPALRAWRERSRAVSYRRWFAPTTTEHEAAAAATGAAGDSVALAKEGGTTAVQARGGFPSPGAAWPCPRAQDRAFMRSMIQDLQAVVSPFVTLSPPPSASGAGTEHGDGGGAGEAPQCEAHASRLYATRDIPAGMIVLSVPTAAALLAAPPPATDPVLHYFMQVEDLVGQLVAAGESPGDGASHYGYVEYLRRSVVPCRNLPYLRRREVEELLGLHAGHSNSDGGGKDSGKSHAAAPALLSQEGLSSPFAMMQGAARSDGSSPALALHRFFHGDMRRAPLSPYLRERLTPDAYRWWVSLVLSRRTGAATLLPLVDKLNHSPVPNCVLTMCGGGGAAADLAEVCGVDVLDNAVAGVRPELLYQPYAHVSTMRDVRGGEELTLCYASAPDGLYAPANRTRTGSSASAVTAGPGPAREAAAAAALEELSAAAADGVGLGSAELAAVGGGGEAAVVAFCRRYGHRGRQEVDTGEGRAAWQLQWGFVPPCDAVYSAADLRQMAALVAEKRVNTRQELFPPSPAHR